MALDIDRYSLCLFAYLYRHYKNTPTSELSAGLPNPASFSLPDDFITEIAECQIAVNRMYRPYLKPVFDRACPWICQSESLFFEFVKRRCLKMTKNLAPILFLTFSAVVSELNLYCLQRGCFRFAGYAPRCLANLIRSSEELTHFYLTATPNRLLVLRNKPSAAVEALKHYCIDILLELQKNPSYVPPVFEVYGQRFMNMKDKLIDGRVQHSTLPVLAEADEDKQTESEPLLGACKPPSPDKCPMCQEINCALYILRFEAFFHLKFFGC